MPTDLHLVSPQSYRQPYHRIKREGEQRVYRCLRTHLCSIYNILCQLRSWSPLRLVAVAAIGQGNIILYIIKSVIASKYTKIWRYLCPAVNCDKLKLMMQSKWIILVRVCILLVVEFKVYSVTFVNKYYDIQLRMYVCIYVHNIKWSQRYVLKLLAKKTHLNLRYHVTTNLLTFLKRLDAKSKSIKINSVSFGSLKLKISWIDLANYDL